MTFVTGLLGAGMLRSDQTAGNQHLFSSTGPMASLSMLFMCSDGSQSIESDGHG